jgi:hypothetical protein
MGVDQGGFEVFVAEEFLDRADGCFEGLLQARFVEMMMTTDDR